MPHPVPADPPPSGPPRSAGRIDFPVVGTHLLAMVAAHAAIFVVSWFLAFLTRWDFRVDGAMLAMFQATVWWVVVVKTLVFLTQGQYSWLFGRVAFADVGRLVFTTTIAALVLFALPAPFLAIYIETHNPANAALLAIAGQYLFVAAAFQIFDGTQAVASGLLRGLQDTRAPMLIAIGGYWLVGFVIAVWLGFATPLGGLGVWIGLAAGLVVVAGLLVWRWSQREAHGLLPDPRPA